MARTKQLQPKKFKGSQVPAKAPRKSLATVSSSVVQKRRYRPGEKATREIRHFQKGTKLLINKAPFRRLLAEIGYSFKADLRFSQSAVEAIQECAESFLVRLFEDCKLCARHRKAQTITVKDMRLAYRLTNK
jgi:histone H3/H4